MGGDEFVVLLPATPHDVASVVADRVAESVARPIDVGSELICLTVSAGLSAGIGGRSADDLLRVADTTMMRRQADAREGRWHADSP